MVAPKAEALQQLAEKSSAGAILIPSNVEGKEIALSPTEAKPAQIIDLMEALKASLAKQPEPPAPKKQAKRADAEAPAKASKKKSAK